MSTTSKFKTPLTFQKLRKQIIQLNYTPTGTKYEKYLPNLIRLIMLVKLVKMT